MLNKILAFKNNKQLFILLAFFTAFVAGCATYEIDSRYVDKSPAELLLKSHLTPSTAEKILIRAHLAKRFPDTVEGMYSKTYIAYQNAQRELELKYLAEMAKKYPDEENSLHYQTFEGDFDTRLAQIKHAIDLHPKFLNYNFIIKLSDLYNETKGANFDDFYALIDMYEKRLGEDIYVFDFARGLIDERTTKDFVKANKYFSSALKKQGGIENWEVWESYFDTKYPQGIHNDEGYDYAYIEEVQAAVTRLAQSTASDLIKKSVSHKLVKNLLADKAKEQDYGRTSLLYEEVNYHYFTSEVVDDLRTVYINNGDEDDLLGFLKNAVKELPNNPDTLGSLADELAYLKEYDKADTYFKRALKHSHVYADKRRYINRYANVVLYPTYRAEEAYQLLQELADSYPLHAPSLNEDFAVAKLYMGDYDEAREYFNEFKANWEGSDEHFPKKMDAIIDGYLKRASTEEASDNETQTPEIVPTTSVYTEWLAISPDGKQFLGNNGSDGSYTLWDANGLSVVDRFDGAILSDSYTKYMTMPVYSPNGRYVAYVTEFDDDLGSVLVVYDLQNRRFSHQLATIKKTSGLAWSPDSEEIVIWNYGRLIKYNLDDDEVVQQGEVKGQDGADRMLWTADGKYLALLERSSDGSIRIFDADTLEQLHRLDQVNWPHALGVSVDGRYIFSADNRSSLHRWDTQDNFAHKSIEIPVLGRIIVGHPTKPEIVINDWRGRNHLTRIDYQKMEILETQLTGTAELRISYINHGNNILASNLEDDVYEIYDAESLDIIEIYDGESAVLSGGAYANTKRDQLVTWDQDGLHVWSVTTGKKLHSWEGAFQAAMADPDNGDHLYVIYKYKTPVAEKTDIIQFDLSDFSEELVVTTGFVIDQWSIDRGKMILSGKPYMPMDEGLDLGAVMVCEIEKDQCNSMMLEMVTQGREYDHLGGTRFTELAVSPDLKHIAVSTAWIDGWKNPETASEVTRVYNVETAELVTAIEQVGELVFKDNETLAIEGLAGLYNKSAVYSIKSGKDVGELGDDFKTSTVASHDSWPSGATFKERNLYVNVSKDNRIEFYSGNNDELVLTILAKRNNNWIAFLPSGEFSASENGSKKVYWTQSGEKLSMAEAIEKFKRDDVIKNKLQIISEQQ